MQRSGRDVNFHVRIYPHLTVEGSLGRELHVKERRCVWAARGSFARHHGMRGRDVHVIELSPLHGDGGGGHTSVEPCVPLQLDTPGVQHRDLLTRRVDQGQHGIQDVERQAKLIAASCERGPRGSRGGSCGGASDAGHRWRRCIRGGGRSFHAEHGDAAALQAEHQKASAAFSLSPAAAAHKRSQLFHLSVRESHPTSRT
mmetsp:Transcript_6619/g.16434  ORF Transcript_6619/g.16434 Transcript_6619/m.16434 type:complete len:200 (+) Transcript_6619:2591-3190(+)